MQTPNGQNADAGKLPIRFQTLSPAQVHFLEHLLSHGIQKITQSLKLIHDIALYHSGVPLDEAEKAALHDLRILWEELERME